MYWFKREHKPEYKIIRKDDLGELRELINEAWEDDRYTVVCLSQQATGNEDYPCLYTVILRLDN